MTANGIRQGHTGGLVLSQLHIGLAVGLTLIACLTAFGGGVIVGMWYKASEQHGPLGAVASVPSPESSSPSPEAASQRPEAQTSVTFYNTLTNSNVAYAPLTPPAAAPPSPPGNAKGTAPVTTPVAAAPSSSAKTDTPGTAAGRGPASSGASESAKATPAVSPPAEVKTDTPNSPPESGKAVPAAKSVTAPTAPVAVPAKPVPPPPTKAARSPASSVASKPTADPVTATPVVKAAAVTHVVQKPAHHTAKETPPQRPAPVAETKTAQASSKTDFSVQVGSFGSSEQAEKLRSNLSQKGYPARVQLSDVPGQGLRYRVRVGNYAERTAASQSAQHLTVQEQVPAIVAGRD